MTMAPKLMEMVFSPKKPVLRFNALKHRSGHDERKGFMMMFSGAVAGLRNPRAHKLIQDHPERALEFIAFVSLLAKFIDGAQRRKAYCAVARRSRCAEFAARKLPAALDEEIRSVA